jgi:hypothetical protein
MCGDGPYVVKAEVELAYAFGRGEVRYFLDFYVVLPPRLLSHEITQHY